MKPFLGKSKPSEFLQAMVDGLWEASRRRGQGVDMSTYGMVSDEDICYGCAATWSLQNLLGHWLPPDKIMALGSVDTTLLKDYEWNGETPRRVLDFETVMDFARTGQLNPLARFCGLRPGKLDAWYGQWFMDSDNWQEEIHKVSAAILNMQERGL